MTGAELATLHPRLWHMAQDGAWPSIRAHGLLSTSALLDVHGVCGEAREAIEARLRPSEVVLARRDRPGAIVRDQKPMAQASLSRCLDDGLTPSDWCRILNGRVFFWPSPRRLDRFLGAYRGRAQTILTFDTASLVGDHEPAIELSPYNSGTTIRNAPRRGLSTFRSLADYPFDLWRAKRSAATAIAEVTVRGSVPDPARHVLRVERAAAGARELLWER